MALITFPLADIGLLVLRVVLGLIFVYHSVPKLKMPAAIAKMMGSQPSFVFILGLVELLSGLSAIIGFFTQIAAILLGIVMLGALYFKIFVWRIPFSAEKTTGWEFDLILLAAAIALLLLGSGVFSIDVLMF